MNKTEEGYQDLKPFKDSHSKISAIKSMHDTKFRLKNANGWRPTKRYSNILRDSKICTIA